MTTTPAWQERPRDQASLFNPAFLGALLSQAADGHRKRSGDGMPWILGFIALPAVLHRETREALPTNVNTSMAVWTRDNALLVGSLPARACVLRPLVSEALLFGLAHRLLQQEDGRLLPGAHRRRSPSDPWREPTDDFRQCASKAAFFGRWCAGSGLPATIYALWGARP
jgi:Family of unknown function (DUF6521)